VNVVLGRLLAVSLNSRLGWMLKVLFGQIVHASLVRHPDTQSNNTQHNDIHHNDFFTYWFICETQHNDIQYNATLTLCSVLLCWVLHFIYSYAEVEFTCLYAMCHYALCRYAVCSGTLITPNSKFCFKKFYNIGYQNKLILGSWELNWWSDMKTKLQLKYSWLVNIWSNDISTNDICAFVFCSNDFVVRASL